MLLEATIQNKSICPFCFPAHSFRSCDSCLFLRRSSFVMQWSSLLNQRERFTQSGSSRCFSSWSATNGHQISFPFTLSLAIVSISFLSPLFLPLCSPVSKKRCRTRWNGKESYSVGLLANENSFGQGLPEYDFVNGAFYTYTQVHERIRILIFHETYVCNKYLVISIYIVQIGLQLCQYRRSNSNDILKCCVQHTRYRRKKFCGEWSKTFVGQCIPFFSFVFYSWRAANSPMG